MLYGAIAQSIPDIDFINSFYMDTADDLFAHRGITHSFLFIILLAPILGYLVWRINRKTKISWKSCSILIGLEMLTHIFLDAFNTYGTGWLEPFSDYRISFNTLFVADPLFTIWPIIACIALLIISPRSRVRNRWSFAGIILPFLYLLDGSANKMTIEKEMKQEVVRQHLPVTNYFTTPTPLNSWLWYIVLRVDSGYYIGYRSVFDRNKKIAFHHVDRGTEYLAPPSERHHLDVLKRFSKGFYTVSLSGDTLSFNDLRFGQQTGWRDPNSLFVFHYYLSHPDANNLVVQRGRFAGWNKETRRSFIERMMGN